MTNERKKISLQSNASGIVRASAPDFHVLHVDDDPNDMALLQAAARKADVHFVLHGVEDGEHAICYLSGLGSFSDRRAYPLPSLILLDLKMPRATGVEVLKWVRRQPEFNHLPVVVLSGSELREDIQHAYPAGATSYLVKPLGFQSLVSLVKDLDLAWMTRESDKIRNLDISKLRFHAAYNAAQISIRVV